MIPAGDDQPLDAPRSRPVRWILVAALGLALGAGIGVGLHEIEQGSDERARLSERVEQQDADLDDQQAAIRALIAQLEERGIKPNIDPDDITDPIDPDDPDDSIAQISEGDLALAIAAYCDDTRQCIGEDGKPGADGEDAVLTPGQVAEAVATYCSADGECEGPRGEPGEDGEDGRPGIDGQDGEDGSTGEQGPAGPPPSDEAVATAVASYCETRNGCQGPQGPPGQDGKDSTVPGPKGEPGTDGEDAPQPTGMTCTSAGEPITITLTYSDGTTVTAECGTAPPVDPETR